MHRLRYPSLAGAALAVLAALAARVRAAPPVQYTPLADLVPAELADRPTSAYRLTPGGRLIVRAKLDVPANNDFRYDGLYVVENGQRTEILAPVASSAFTQPEVMALRSYEITDEGRIAAVVYNRGGADDQYAIREYRETAPGQWEWSEIVRCPAGCYITRADRSGDEWRWVESETSPSYPGEGGQLYRLVNNERELLLDMDDVAQSFPGYTSFRGVFLHLGVPDRLLIQTINDDGLWGDVYLYTWPLGGVGEPEPVAGFFYDDISGSGLARYAMNDSGGLMMSRVVWTEFDQPPIDDSVSWTPVGPSVTPAFSVPIDPGGGPGVFVGVPSWGGVATNNRGRVLYVATRPDGINAAYVGPDPVADRVWQEGDAIHGLTTTRVQLRGELSERDQFLADLQFADDSSLAVLGTICPADVNRDGVMDHGDIGDWIDLYLNSSLRADFTNDGLLDNGDITEFVIQFLEGC